MEAVDHARGTVTLRLSRGRERVFRPEKLHTRPTESLVQLYEAKTLQLHERDRIRWTANVCDQALFNADKARVVSIDAKRVTIETSHGTKVALLRDDPMLQHLNLAYALNAHMAQSLTSDRASGSWRRATPSL
ncbi:hypothetical protein [Sphingomonas sp.]|uniref:hypothetical protein n=1 Tax=Sphingomonas sp. TaxID=28214 RepID=UPI003AFF9C63